MKNNENILIIGAGLCGSLLALRLGQRGYKVQVIEKRSDIRQSNLSTGRSINLALSNRGLKALKMVGLEDKVKSISIPMYGRMLHDKVGNKKMSKYSGRNGEYINSISREILTSLLINEAELLNNVNFEFNQNCWDIDFENNIAYFKNDKNNRTTEFKADVIFGTDGAGSILRKNYLSKNKFLFDFSQSFLGHGYKELTIPSNQGKHRIEKNALHIWPRGSFMIIALPNLDGSFTVTLFLSYNKGHYNFNNLTTKENIYNFFLEEFPDALELMPNLTEDFLKNPTGPLGTIKCFPWQYKGKNMILGDASHAIVPFYGQGMNASFEDVYELDKALTENNENWESTFKYFENSRKLNTDAIADLAIDNFHEMKDHVADKNFQQKRNLEMNLESKLPGKYFSKYSLVTFREDIGYFEAMSLGRAQDKCILEMIKNKSTDLDLPEKELNDIIQKKSNHILKNINYE